MYRILQNLRMNSTDTNPPKPPTVEPGFNHPPPDPQATHPAAYTPGLPANPPDPISDDYPDYTYSDILVYYTYRSADPSRLHPYQNVPQHYNNEAYARAGYSPYDPRNYWIQHADGSYSVNPYYHDYSDDKPPYL
ncbi:Hypp8664 [Branchiostoma lanceolatum]|uniref:Hypp8664 protein n=1 Tax=Branchiostoma lanceolatum TaxID=7740 RepID=A0A8J9Z9P6_BRALA|nr:Hypp8664 [Branchiostoma lanceolatum]